MPQSIRTEGWHIEPALVRMSSGGYLERLDEVSYNSPEEMLPYVKSAFSIMMSDTFGGIGIEALGDFLADGRVSTLRIGVIRDDLDSAIRSVLRRHHDRHVVFGKLQSIPDLPSKTLQRQRARTRCKELDSEIEASLGDVAQLLEFRRLAVSAEPPKAVRGFTARERFEDWQAEAYAEARVILKTLVHCGEPNVNQANLLRKFIEHCESTWTSFKEEGLDVLALSDVDFPFLVKWLHGQLQKIVLETKAMYSKPRRRYVEATHQGPSE